MRTFEFILILTHGLSILRFLSRWLRKRLPSPWFELAALLMLGLHLGLEHYRWQMLPTYILLILILTVGWLRFRQAPASGRPRRSLVLFTGFVGILFLSSTLLPILLPVPQLTPPTGPYAVGTRSWHWIDSERVDLYAPTARAQRELMIQAWYPIEKDVQGERSPWMPSAEIVAPAVAQWLNLPSFFLDHLVLVSSLALEDADIATNAQGFPVLLFSHGFGGFRAQNTHQMQHLASNGFVILAVEHTYASVVSVFPDGRVAYHNPDTLPDGLPPLDDLQAARDLGTQWAEDLSFVLDQLTTLQLGSNQNEWQDKLDLTRVGAFGHSTGAGAAIEFCFRDSRCSATLPLDPFMKPVSENALQEGLRYPSLHMFSELWPSDENLERFTPFAQQGYPKPLVLSVLGSDHYDFSDLPLLSPLAHRIGLKGPINGNRMISLVDTYLLAYFDQMLKDHPSDLLSSPSSDYPEVIYQSLIADS